MIGLLDTSGAGVSSQMLQIPTDLSPFETATWAMRVSGATDPEFGGHITSIQLVPEPSLAALLGAGVLAIALRRRA